MVVTSALRPVALNDLPLNPLSSRVWAGAFSFTLARALTKENRAKHICMQEQACNQNGPTLLTNTGSFSSVYEAVAALTTQHLNRLERTAESQLRQLSRQSAGEGLLPLGDPSDFVGEAIQAVLEGEQIPGKGRNTHPRHLMSLEVFLSHLHGVIQSQIGHQFESALLKGQHVSLDMQPNDARPVELIAAEDIVRDVSLVETRRELFGRLRAYYQNRPAFLRSIELWEQSWLVDNRIPKGELSDKQVHELRFRAQLELRSQAVQEGLEFPNGTEMFGP